MDVASLSTFLKQGLALTLMLSLPTVIVIAVVGLAVALLQAEGVGTLELTSSKCFDAKGAVLADAEVTLEDAR